MQAYCTLVRRELGSHFLSWAGYIVIAAVLFLLGLSFDNLLQLLNAEATDLPVTELFYVSYYFWLILLLMAPVITMRSFALEKSTGTFETLMTTPVCDLEVMLAKFTGAMLFYGLMWLPLLACLFTVQRYSNSTTMLDAGAVGATYLGIMLLGSVYVSIGCFASALTRSQIIAAVVSFAAGFSLFLFSFLAKGLAGETGWTGQALAHLNMTDHMQDFARGVVDTRPVVLYLSLTAVFLFLTFKALESRRWK